MKISRNNYEEYFIDYLDGNLSDFQIQELETLLMNNEDLREELEGMEKIFLKSDSTSFRLKENLKQPDLSNSVNESNYEFYCIAEIEGDLSAEQTKELNEFLILDSKREQTRNLFQKTKLSPPANINFKNKANLKRNVFTIRKIAVYRSLSIAAGIILLLALFFTFIEKDVESVLVAGLETVEESTDTMAVKTVEPIISTKPATEEKIKTEADKIKTKSSVISFKVETPIASAETQSKDIVNNQENEQQEIAIAPVNIDITAVLEPMLLVENPSDKIEPEKLKIAKLTDKKNTDEYLTIQELAKKKYYESVFKDGEKKEGFWGVASAGVSKISERTGSEMSLNTIKDEEGENKKVSFNSRLLSFSTPINRD
ncbi:MAG: hypothetical protein K9H49_09840 [Bacteroidales bacterium]|nr:hypothetical protein [Bacteroidales bacterium]MCF8389652.1 hypothetical protein [Bacteroidales bacterium]